MYADLQRFLISDYWSCCRNATLYYPFDEKGVSGKQWIFLLLSNFAFLAAPQILWWLVCTICWTCWKSSRNCGCFLGGIVGADLLLVFMIWLCLSGRNENAMGWLWYVVYCLPMILVGALIGWRLRKTASQ